jgi:hypothetical protein
MDGNFRNSPLVMIAKTLFFAKTFPTYSTEILRQEKSLRDHEAIMKGGYMRRVVKFRKYRLVPSTGNPG